MNFWELPRIPISVHEKKESEYVWNTPESNFGYIFSDKEDDKKTSVQHSKKQRLSTPVINKNNFQSNPIHVDSEDPNHNSTLIKQCRSVSTETVVDNNSNNKLDTLASLIAEKYSLNPQLNMRKILEFFALKKEVTDSNLNNSINDASSKIMKLLNYDPNDSKNVTLLNGLQNSIEVEFKNIIQNIKENSKCQDNTKEITKEDRIEECKLDLIFFPNYNKEIDLAELAEVKHQVVKLWLAEANGDLGKILELNIEKFDFNNAPHYDRIMRKDHLEDIKTILSIDILKNQYREFKEFKTKDEQVKYINDLILKKSASARCKVSQIYVASMLLIFAVLEKNMEIIKTLLDLKADPRIEDLIDGPTSISYALLEKDFIEEFLQEIVNAKYELVKRKAKCDIAMYHSLRFIDNYEHKDQIMQKLCQLYDFDFEDSDYDS